MLRLVEGPQGGGGGSKKAQKPREARGSPRGRGAVEGKGSGRCLQRTHLPPTAPWGHHTPGPGWLATHRGLPADAPRLGQQTGWALGLPVESPRTGDGGSEGREEGEWKASADLRVSRPPVLSEELSGRDGQDG